jgi:hypothetical protein
MQNDLALALLVPRPLFAGIDLPLDVTSINYCADVWESIKLSVKADAQVNATLRREADIASKFFFLYYLVAVHLAFYYASSSRSQRSAI